MSKTYEPIATITLTSDASNIEFTSIPQTYTDLVCVLTGRTSRTATVDEAVQFRVGNGSVDSGSNYSLTNILSTGSSAISQRLSNQTSAEWGAFATSTSGNTTPSMAILQIMSYANTNINKTALGESARSEGAFGRYVSLWRSNSAITNLRLAPVNGPNFVSGTSAALYGIKAESPVLPLLTASTATASSVSAIISNYDAGLTYTVASTAGTATRSTNTVTVSGLTGGQNITLTVTATDSNNSSSQQSITLSTLSLVAGYVAGGYTSSSPVSSIEKYTFSNDARSTLTATLSGQRWVTSGMSSTTAGYVVGGQSGSQLTTVDKLLFSNESISTLGTGLSNARQNTITFESSLNGYVAGGYGAPGNTWQGGSIDKFNFSNDTRSAGPSLPAARGDGGGVSSTNNGYIMGGQNSSTGFSSIIKIDFSNDAISTLSATLPTVKASVAAFQSSSIGFIAGGGNGSTNTSSSIEKLNFSTESVSVSSTTLSAAKNYLCGFNSSNAGYIAAGATGAGGFAGWSQTVEKILFSNETRSSLTSLTASGGLGPAGFEG